MGVYGRSVRNALLQSEGIQLQASSTPGAGEILTPDALCFVAELARRFDPTRRELLDEVTLTAEDLLTAPEGEITQTGFELNLDVGSQYLESWLMGNGCVPIYNLMEDAATAEIFRTQLWQWITHRARLTDGRPIDAELVRRAIAQQLEKAGSNSAQLFEEMSTSKDFPRFSDATRLRPPRLSHPRAPVGQGSEFGASALFPKRQRLRNLQGTGSSDRPRPPFSFPPNRRTIQTSGGVYAAP
jgi:malate synthase